jgi:6-phosphogluconolactonase
MKTYLMYMLLMIVAIACSKPNQNQTESTSEVEKMKLLVGTYTGKGSEGIYQISFNPETGALSDTLLLVESNNPSYLTQSTDGQLVYAVNETADGGVSAFQWNKEQSALELIGMQKSQGDYPCYIDINPINDQIALANYGTGNVVSYGLMADGTLSEVGTDNQHEGQGPNEERQEGPHAHFSQFSQDGKNLYAIDLGIDKVMRYPLDSGKVGEGEVALSLEPGDGPRHLVFHPTKPLVYVITELSNVVVGAKVLENGNFEAIGRFSTLPENFEGDSYCADIHISNDGRYLYASNRGHNSIAIFSVGQEDGKLQMVATESVYGDWPRNFTLSPDNKFLLVANQNSDNITVFKRDTETGMLHYTDQQIKLSQPVCLLFQN